MNLFRVLLATILSFALFGCATVPPTGPQVVAWNQDEDSVLFLMDSKTWCSDARDEKWFDLVIEDRVEGSRYEGCWHPLEDGATLRVYVHPMGFGIRPVQGLEFKKPPPFQPDMTHQDPRDAPASTPGSTS